MWTKNDITRMSENELRTKVLIPLFRAMGYQDVVDHHGGPHEQGRDIVMWKADSHHGRQNYAVVAKAERVSGRVEGRGSAGVVVFQTLQCFGKPFQDPHSSDERHVNHVFVVCSKEITTEANIAIRSALGGARSSDQVTLIDIDGLWAWIREFLPRDALLDLQHISRVFEEVDDRIRLSASLSDGNVQVSFEPREGQVPIEIKLGVNFPTTTEGREAAEAFQRHRRTGEPVTLDGQFITSFEVPDALRALVHDKPAKIAIESAQVLTGPSVRVRLEAHSKTGTTLAMPGLEFRPLRSGEEEGTLTNDHQGLPWIIRLTFNYMTRAFEMHFTVRPGDYPVSRVLQTLRFQNALADGGTMHIFDEDAEICIGSHEYPTGMLQRFPDEMRTFFESVYDIQVALATPFIIPRNIERLDIERSRRVHQIIRAGRDLGRWSTFRTTVPRDVAQSFLDGTWAGREMCIAIWRDESAERVFGASVDLGPVLTVLRGLTLAEGERDGVRRQIASEVQGVFLELVPITARDNAEQYYPRFLSAEEIATLRTQIPMRWLAGASEEAGGVSARTSILFHTPIADLAQPEGDCPTASSEA